MRYLLSLIAVAVLSLGGSAAPPVVVSLGGSAAGVPSAGSTFPRLTVPVSLPSQAPWGHAPQWMQPLTQPALRMPVGCPNGQCPNGQCPRQPAGAMFVPGR